MATELKNEPEVRTPVPNPHIWLDHRGVAWVGDTNVKVIELVLDKTASGMDPGTIHQEYPDISLAEIHAAFMYYYDHQSELDAQIERGYQESEKLRAEAGESPLLKKLRAAGRQP